MLCEPGGLQGIWTYRCLPQLLWHWCQGCRAQRPLLRKSLGNPLEVVHPCTFELSGCGSYLSISNEKCFTDRTDPIRFDESSSDCSVAVHRCCMRPQASKARERFLAIWALRRRPGIFEPVLARTGKKEFGQSYSPSPWEIHEKGRPPIHH